MKPLLGALLLAGLVSTSACSSVDVRTDYDTTADFASLRTWDWFPDAPTGADPLTQGRVREAVEAALPARGFVRAPGTPDFLVACRVSLKERIEVDPSTVAVGYGWRRGRLAVASTPGVRTYEEGTLALDVVQPSTKTLLWRGVARGAVDPASSPEERAAKIRDVVGKILEEFPPAKGR